MAQVGLIHARPTSTRPRPPRSALNPPKRSGRTAARTPRSPFFCDFVLKTILNDKTFGANREDRVRLLLRGGLTITTTLDRDAQADAQQALADHVEPDRQGRLGAGVGAAGHRADPGDGGQPRLRRPQEEGRDQVQPGHRPCLRRQQRLPGRVDVQGLRRGGGARGGLSRSATRSTRRTRRRSGTCRAAGGTLTDPWDPANESSSENGTYTLQTGIEDSVNTYFAQLEERVGVCRPAHIAARPRRDHGRRQAAGSRSSRSPWAPTWCRR